MALTDYRLCDLCDDKVFDDTNLNYEYDAEVESVRNTDYNLQNLGDWKVLCKKCAKTHEVVIIDIGDIGDIDD